MTRIPGQLRRDKLQLRVISSLGSSGWRGPFVSWWSWGLAEDSVRVTRYDSFDEEPRAA
jgi:hypothetical protein